MLFGILSVPYNIIMDLNNVMYLDHFGIRKTICRKTGFLEIVFLNLKKCYGKIGCPQNPCLSTLQIQIMHFIHPLIVEMIK